MIKGTYTVMWINKFRIRKNMARIRVWNTDETNVWCGSWDFFLDQVLVYALAVGVEILGFAGPSSLLGRRVTRHRASLADCWYSPILYLDVGDEEEDADDQTDEDHHTGLGEHAPQPGGQVER